MSYLLAGLNRLPKRLLKWQYLGLCLLVLLTLALHFAVIMQPGEPIFDEQHYVKDARLIIEQHETARAEHPPLGKLFIVAGILIFGDNPFGWRFFSVVFGTLCLALFYLICRRLGMPEKAAFLAALLLALENLSFVQAGVAMLDVYCLAFMLLAFWLYLRGRYPLAGIAVGLATLVKLTGALALPVICLHWLFIKRPRPLKFLLLVLLAPLSFVALMPLFDFMITHQWLSPVARIETMLGQSASLTFATVSHPSACRPWEWLMLPRVPYYWYDPHYTGAISFTVWALIIPAAVYMVFRAKKGSAAALFGLAWLAGAYLLWIPATIITDRVTYLYYFYPAVGAVCIGIGLGLARLLDIRQSRSTGKLRRAVWPIVATYLLLHAGVFVVLTPVLARWVRVLELICPH